MEDPDNLISQAAANLADEPRKEDDETMYCTQCGTRNPDDANFCQKCGRQIGRAIRPLDDAEYSVLQQPEDRVGDLLATAFKRREQGDMEGAIRACATALQVRPESTSAHSLLGMLFEEQGEKDKAITQFERVLSLNPGSIADREKLEQLRDATTAITPRKITSSQKKGTTLFDSPAGAAAAAVAVFLLVLGIGAWAAWTRDRNRVEARTTTQSAAGPINQQTPGPMPSQQVNSSSPTPVFNYGWPAGVNPVNPNVYAANSQITMTQPNGPTQPVPANEGPRVQKLPTYGTPFNAGRVSIPPAPISNLPRLSAAPIPGSENTVHLPDNNGLARNELGPGPNPAVRTGTDSPRSNPGKIEIIVSQDGGNSAAPGTPSTTPASMDSRSRQAIANQAQLEGDYRRAAREYLKSLDGSGDDAAGIHQKIGICYQRLDDKASAIAHYNDAIAEYKRQIAAGRNVDSAQSGIKACERSLKVLQ